MAIGRVFFGICIVGIGALHFIYPGIRPIIVPKIMNIPSRLYGAEYLVALILIVPGVLICTGKRFSKISLVMGVAFLALFLFVHLPALLLAGQQNRDPWISLNKVLALSGGFFIVSTINKPATENRFFKTLNKLASIGMYLYAIMLYNFSVAHIAGMNSISTLVPKYIPFPEFWTFTGGIVLMGSAISVFTGARTEKILLLLAAVLFIWLLSLHLYYAVRYPEWNEGENFVGVITCLAFCGIALMIAQTAAKKRIATESPNSSHSTL